MYHVLVAGGDKRNVYLANEFCRSELNVYVCGFDNGISFDEKVRKFNPGASDGLLFDIIVFGLPLTSDNTTINAPLGNECIYISDIVPFAKKDAIILGGRISPETSAKFPVVFTDYSTRDDFCYLNAVPTAEGAIDAAMKMACGTVSGSLCAVTGFGKCAEILANTLKGMNADVHIFARGAKDLAHAHALGFKAIHLENMKSCIHRYNMIYNTVPFGIFDSECTKRINPECIFIDIASNPGGICHDADKTNFSYNFLPGIPGKYSPHAAAIILKKVMASIMREKGKDAYKWLLTD